jgi:hypothetical protein
MISPTRSFLAGTALGILQGNDLLAAARDAFVASLHAGAGLGAAAATAAVALGLRLVRRVP